MYTMVLIFLKKFLIFLFYYVGITAFIMLLYVNNIIYLFEENIFFKNLHPSKAHHSIETTYDIIIGELFCFENSVYVLI